MKWGADNLKAIPDIINSNPRDKIKLSTTYWKLLLFHNCRPLLQNTPEHPHNITADAIEPRIKYFNAASEPLYKLF